MNKASLAAVALAALTLAACGRDNPDQLNESDVNTEVQNLDALSDDAANVASEAQALENHAAQLEKEATATENASGPETPADENIQGM